jgi:hypothetical protein
MKTIFVTRFRHSLPLLAAMATVWAGGAAWAVPATPVDGAVYVATTGNDDTGDGAEGTPYATVEGAFQDAYAQAVGNQKATTDMLTLFDAAVGWADNVIFPVSNTTATLVYAGGSILNLTADLDLTLRLESLGYNVELVDDTDVQDGDWNSADAADTSVIVISESVGSGNVGNIPALNLPVVNMEPFSWDEFQYASAPGGTNTTTGTQINITSPGSPLAGGLTGTVDAYISPYVIGYTTSTLVAAGATVVATIDGQPSKICLYGFETGAALVTGNATARNVAFPLFSTQAPGQAVITYQELVGEGTMVLSAGTYDFDGTLNLVSGVKIQGGWNATYDDFSPTTNSAVFDWSTRPAEDSNDDGNDPAISAGGDDWTLEGLTIQNNSDDDKGAGLYMNGASGVVRSCLFRELHCVIFTPDPVTREGGAIYLRAGASLNIYDSTIVDCTATRAGAAFDLDDSGGGNCTLVAERCLIADNYAGRLPSGDFSSDGYHVAVESKHVGDDVTIVNSVFVNNTTSAFSSGGNAAIMRFAGTVRFYNNTVDANIGSNAGGGGWFCRLASGDADNTTEFTNNIFSNNRIAHSGNQFFGYTGTEYAIGVNFFALNNLFFNNTNSGGSAATTFNSPTGGSMIGINGNFNADPQYTDAGSRDYSLGGSSPAVDAGRTVAGITDDYLGNDRPRGLGFDVGAYERQTPLVNATRDWMLF